MVPKSLKCDDAATLLRERKTEIIHDWERCCRDRLPAARKQSRPALLNSMPGFIEGLASALSAPRADAGAIAEYCDSAQMHGYQRAALEGYTLSQIIHEYSLLRRTLLRCLERTEPLAVECRQTVHEFLDQGIGEAAASFARIESEQALVKRQQNEVQLASERHKLAAIFLNSPAAMALWRGPEMIFELVNPRYQALFPGRQLVGLPFQEALPELANQPFMEIFRRVLETGEPFHGIEVLARHRRTEAGPIEDRYYDFCYVRINDPDGRPYGVYDHAFDVTDRVLARRELEESRNRLQEMIDQLQGARESRERFVATLSHDLRTPLTTARLTAQLMARSEPDAESLIRFSGRIVDCLKRVDEMLRNLLDANRIKAGERLPIEVEACDLNALVASCLEDLTTLHGERFVLRAPTPISGFWSPSGLRRIIENLCGNAIKYGAPDRPVTVTLERMEGEAQIEVHNEGTPIPVEDRATIFAPFSRARPVDESAQTSWGLGLTVVRGIAEAHRGRTWLESSASTGTSFFVRLPLGAPK